MLGLTNTGNAYARLSRDQKHNIRRTDVGGFRPGKNLIAISESGLYKLILRSDKSQAKPFQDWVTRVVLPAIRKDGGYSDGRQQLPAD